MRVSARIWGSRNTSFAPGRLVAAALLAAGWIASARADHCIDYRKFIPELGRVTLGATAVGVAQAGDHAYIAQGAAGLQVVDVSDPSAPTVVATIGALGTVLDVEAQGTVLYVANGVDLQLLDLTTPASPSLLGSVPIAGAAKLFLDGTRVYVAAGAMGGLVIVDASQSTSPTILGSFNHARGILNVAVEGTTAYVILDGLFGPPKPLGIVDVTNPEAPALVAETSTLLGGSEPYDLAVQGDRLFLTSTNARIYEIDVTIPTSLQIVDNILLTLFGGFPNVLDQEGARVYAATSYVFGVTEPTSSGFAAHVLVDLSLPGTAPALKVKGGRAYLGAGAQLQIFDVSGPLGPTNVGFVDTPGSAADVSVDGVLAFVADGAAGGLQILEVEDPEAPVVLGSIDTPGSARRVAAVNRIACVADGNAVQIIDASVPTAPVLASTLAFTNVRDVAMRGNLLLVHHNGGLTTIDVSNPSGPVQLGLLSTSVLTQIEISGDYAYGLANEHVRVFDLRDPVNPSLLTSRQVQTPTINMAIAADRLFVTGMHHNDYAVFDLSNPAQLTPLLQQSFTDDIGLVAADASSAYIVDFNGRWLRIWDAAPPSVTTRAYAALVQGLPDLGVNVRADAGRLYVLGGSRGVFVFPLHCESPTSVGDPETQSARSTRLEIWPNPARTEALVAFVAPKAGAVRLEVFDVAGRRVRDAFAGTVGAGRHVVRWDGRDAAGAAVGSGVYIVRLSGPGGAAVTRRVALIH